MFLILIIHVYIIILLIDLLLLLNLLLQHLIGLDGQRLALRVRFQHIKEQ